MRVNQVKSNSHKEVGAAVEGGDGGEALIIILEGLLSHLHKFCRPSMARVHTQRHQQHQQEGGIEAEEYQEEAAYEDSHNVQLQVAANLEVN